MIIPMNKYDFLVFHGDHNKFLEGLRELGVLHIKSSGTELSQPLLDILDRLKKIREYKNILLNLRTENNPNEESVHLHSGRSVMEKIESLQTENQHLQLKLQNLENAISYAEPWGMFSTEILNTLKDRGVTMHMYSCSERKFNPDWKNEYTLEVIAVRKPEIFFVIFQSDTDMIDIKADRLAWPELPFQILMLDQQKVIDRMKEIRQELTSMCDDEANTLRNYEQEVYTEMQILEANEQSAKLNDEKLMRLTGFVPETKVEDIEKYCNSQKIFYITQKVTPKDNPPILLKNHRFSQLYEAIGKLYSLPSYAEIDLTPYFAPFFMMFFGLCLGDAGYGLLLLIAASLYKLQVNRALLPILTLGQWLGLATIIFGIITGTFFGMNLLGDKFAFLGTFRSVILESNQIFNFALILGFLQIIFGLCLQIANKVKQYGWKYSVMPVAWICILFSIADLAVFKITGGFSIYIIYVSIAAILLFNDPDTKILPRIGKGIWELYGITGFVGDLLSYIRLFALGISGAILGLVVNNIALRMLNVHWIGPVLFVAFLIFGHGLNLMISSLGAFVHPLRLTFVEFYKNAGFTGGGKEYKPFGGNV